MATAAPRTFEDAGATGGSGEGGDTDPGTGTAAPPGAGAPAPRARGLSARGIAVVAHRWVGLALAVFLAVAGLTGSLLAFYQQLDAVAAPGLHRAAPPAPGAAPLDPLALREALQARLPPGAAVTYVPLELHAGRSLPLGVEAPAAAAGSGAAADDEYFVDPYTGETLGSRRWGDLDQGAKNLMPFVYRLHYSLALDDVGILLLGVVALLWTIDCFVGLALTFPPRRRPPAGRAPGGAARGRSWLARWGASWILRTGKLFSLVFSWHRASGLWVWALLLVFAWSSVGLNLGSVYRPVMGAVLPMAEGGREALRALPAPREAPRLDWRAAHAEARALMAREAAARDFEVIAERSLSYDRGTGTYRYRVRSTRDVSDRHPATQLWLDGDSGALVAFEAPTGEAAGTTATTWLYNLHWGSIAAIGLPYRVLVSLAGILIVLLSVTGVWIWWRKRRRGPRGAAG